MMILRDRSDGKCLWRYFKDRRRCKSIKIQALLIFNHGGHETKKNPLENPRWIMEELGKNENRGLRPKVATHSDNEWYEPMMGPLGVVS